MPSHWTLHLHKCRPSSNLFVVQTCFLLVMLCQPFADLCDSVHKPTVSLPRMLILYQIIFTIACRQFCFKQQCFIIFASLWALQPVLQVGNTKMDAESLNTDNRFCFETTFGFKSSICAVMALGDNSFTFWQLWVLIYKQLLFCGF